MRSIGMRKLIGYGAFAAVFALLLFAWMKWRPGARIQKHDGGMVAQLLPLSFEVNRGQASADAKFVARGGGYALTLTDQGEPVLALHRLSRQAAESPLESRVQADSGSGLRKPREQTLLRLEFPGGNHAPQVQGEQLMAARSNYLIGNDPAKWLTGVPHYRQVRYREVFPGVDVLYYAKDQQLEYDFIVRPGTQSDSIRFTVQGAQGIESGEQSSLVLKTAAGRVVLHKPVAYQQGPAGEQEVACNYVLDDGQVRFALGDYDRSQVLRIDPVLSFSKPLDVLIRAIAVDASGNSYLAGSTVSANFPTNPSAFQPTNGGNSDAVIAKLDPTGSTLLFATYLGGSGSESANSIALDSNGNVIVAGSTVSTNFPLNNAFQWTLLGNEDAFLSKLNADGTQLLYSTYLGGSSSDWALGVALDASGRAVVTGGTNSPNFPTTAGELQAVYGGNLDAFIAKLDTTKSGAASLLFSTYLGGSNRDAAGAIAVDATGNVFVTGLTMSSNFPTANPLQASCASCPSGSDTGLIPTAVADAFVTKLNAAGTALLYSTFLGGNMGDAGNAIALDKAGNAYVAGTTFSWSNFPTTVGAFQTSFQQQDTSNVFVTKLNAAGSAFVYSTFIGGDYHDDATGIALDAAGNAYVTGGTSSLDFPTVNSLQGPGGGVCDFVLFPDSCSDAMVAKLNATGSAMIYSTYLGHANINESGTAVAVDSAGNAYVAGASNVSSGTDLLSLIRLGPPSFAGNDVEPTGFAAKISTASVGTEATTITLVSSPNPSSQGQAVTFTATVTPPNAGGVVNFYVDKDSAGSATLNAGAATRTRASLSQGNHSVKAEYLGDSTYAANTSASLIQNVNGISLTSTQTSASVTRGGTASFPLTVGQAGVLSSAISFSCSGLPAGWNCGFNPATVPAGSGPTQVTLTVQAGSTTAQNPPRAPIGVPGMRWETRLGGLLLFTLVVLLGRRVRRAVCLRPGFALGLAAVLLLLAGCGSTSSQPPQSPQPQPFTVNFTVNATSGATATSMPLSITVR